MEMAVQEILDRIKRDVFEAQQELNEFRATNIPDYVIEQCKGRILALTYVRDWISFTYGDFDE